MERIKLSNRELDVMNILWEVKKPLIAKDFTKYNPELGMNTVLAVLKNLLKRGYIKVAEITYSGTVLTRAYLPVLDPNEYMLGQVMNGKGNKRISTEGIVAALLNQDECTEETIDKLEDLLKEYRRKLNEEN